MRDKAATVGSRRAPQVSPAVPTTQERPDPGTTSARDRAAWLSSRDAADLVRSAVEADVRGVVVGNGISANRYRHADLEATISTLGYRPVNGG